MTRILQQIGILLWKHFILRKRHYFLTILDIILPILLLYLYLKSLGGTVIKEQMVPKYAEIKSDKEIYESFERKIYYAPRTDFTLKMFEKIRSKLVNVQVYPFVDEESLLQNSTSDEWFWQIIAVVFRKIDGNNQPDQLYYRIFFKGDSWEDKLFARSNSGAEDYFNRGFIALQLALDATYIEMVSSKNLPVNIAMQEFPSVYEDSYKLLYTIGFGYSIIYGFLASICTLWSKIAEEKSIGIKFLKNVGYCPQYDAFNELLTGRQMLKVFALLRGLSKNTDDVVEKCIGELGLKEFENKRCGNYSGGNKRKLNVAMALIGRPQLVMFDEPTSGVDPVSRRKLWDVLNGLHQQDAKLGFILSSHSMDECEVLCTRLAIMKAGQLECCGTIPYLKIQFGQGFTIILKVNPSLSVTADGSLKDNEQTTSATTSIRDTGDKTINGDHPEVRKVMLEFEQKYKGFCVLKDKHPGMLHYHISDTTKKWSQVFSEMDALQKKYPVIEDYNISETTLEEIFLQIARSQ